MTVTDNTLLSDRIGIGVSGLCVAHCLAFSVALAALPLLPAASLVHAWLHPVFALLLVPTTLLAIRSARRRDRTRGIPAILAAGLMVVLAAGVLGHEMPGTFVETTLTMSGSVLLIAGHWRNWRMGSSCRMDLPGPPERTAVKATAVRSEAAAAPVRPEADATSGAVRPAAEAVA